jgi:hypothetical protein
MRCPTRARPEGPRGAERVELKSVQIKVEAAYDMLFLLTEMGNSMEAPSQTPDHVTHTKLSSNDQTNANLSDLGNREPGIPRKRAHDGDSSPAKRDSSPAKRTKLDIADDNVRLLAAIALAWPL